MTADPVMAQTYSKEAGIDINPVCWSIGSPQRHTSAGATGPANQGALRCAPKCELRSSDLPLRQIAMRKSHKEDAMVVELKESTKSAEEVAEALRNMVPMREVLTHRWQRTGIVEALGEATKLRLTTQEVHVSMARDRSLCAFRKVPASKMEELMALSIRIGWTVCKLVASERRIRCDRCGQLDHVAATCRGEDRTKQCFRCGEDRHLGAHRQQYASNPANRSGSLGSHSSIGKVPKTESNPRRY